MIASKRSDPCSDIRRLAEKGKFVIANSYLYNQLLQERTLKAALNWRCGLQKGERILDKAFLLFPICQNSHWSCYIILLPVMNNEPVRGVYLDSLNPQNPVDPAPIFRYLELLDLQESKEVNVLNAEIWQPKVQSCLSILLLRH